MSTYDLFALLYTISAIVLMVWLDLKTLGDTTMSWNNGKYKAGPERVDITGFYEKAITLIRQRGKASQPLLRKQLKVSNLTALRLLDKLKQNGYIRTRLNGRREVIKQDAAA